jgi:hypothetical protein
MKNKIMKVLGIVMTVAMLASFMVAGAPVSAAGNPASINEWEGVTLPTMVPVSDVDLIEQANDGTIFISVFFGTATIFDGVAMGLNTWAMLKSMDGYAWEATNVNNEPDRITAIEPPPTIPTTRRFMSPLIPAQPLRWVWVLPLCTAARVARKLTCLR